MNKYVYHALVVGGALALILLGVKVHAQEVSEISVCNELVDAQDLMRADQEGTLEAIWEQKVIEHKCGDRVAPWYIVDVVARYDTDTPNILAHIKIQGRTQLWDGYALIAGPPFRKA